MKPLILIIPILLTGCATLENTQLSDASNKVGEWLAGDKSPSSQSDQFDSDDIEALLAQPYIDPLTRFINRQSQQGKLNEEVRVVRQEREQRCEAVASSIKSQQLDEALVDRFERGYGTSCPTEVQNLKAELAKLSETEAVPETTAVSNQTEPTESATQNRQEPSDPAGKAECYLLLSIKNYGEAQDVCKAIAQSGDARAANGLAQIAYLDKDYRQARLWAERAADEFADSAFILGQIYENAEGVERQISSAKYWYRQAYDLGSKDAVEALRRVQSLSD